MDRSEPLATWSVAFSLQFKDGLVLHWQTKSGDFLDRYIPSQDQGGDVEVLDLLGGGNDSAINSLHVDGSDLVFGTDNEAIVVVSNVIDY